MTRWYWAINCGNSVNNPFVADSADLGVEPEELVVGRSLEYWCERAHLRANRAENDGTPDDVLQNYLGLPVYSARLRTALETAEVGGIQYLPVHLLRPGGQEIKGFSIANIVERREALDLTRSDYDTFPNDYFITDRIGKVRGIRRAVLLIERLSGCDISRLDEFPSSVYVSERFKRIFDAGECTGYEFHEVKTVSQE